MRLRIAPPRRRLLVWAVVVPLLALAAPRLRRENLFSAGGRVPEARVLPPLPDAPDAWIGAAPLSLADLHGRVWVLKVWTFDCVNCIRSIPYANGLVERFDGAVGVLGVHSPEFEHERDEARLRAAMREHDVRFPTVVDRDLAYLCALEVEAWPAFYVVDREARIRGAWFGEVHAGTLRARELEALVEELLAE